MDSLSMKLLSINLSFKVFLVRRHVTTKMGKAPQSSINYTVKIKMSATQQYSMFTICLLDISCGVKNGKSSIQSWLLAQIFVNIKRFQIN